MWKRHKQVLARITVFSLFLFALTGCGMFGSKERAAIDPPPVAYTMSELDDLRIGDEGMSEGELMFTRKMIYLLDDHGYVVPVSMHIPYSEAIAQQVLRYMVKGGPVEEFLPIGFDAPLPAGTTFTMDIVDGVATVDFSTQFAQYDIANEQAILDAVTWALTEFPTIESVKLQMNGTALEEMPMGKTPVRAQLNRTHGINLEMGIGALPGRTTAVTLFFEGEDATGELRYYVPVTRLIPKTADITRATLEELIKGPKMGTELVYSLTPGTQVLNTYIEKGTAIADFDEMIQGLGDIDPTGHITARGLETIVLSLAATEGVQKVQIMVNGKADWMTEYVDFTQPVSVPKQINAITF